MEILKEIVESMDIIAEKKLQKATQFYYGAVQSILDSGKKCIININGENHELRVLGGIVEKNKVYAVALPQNNINQAFVIGEGNNSPIALPLSISEGGTGADNVVDARANLGIEAAAGGVMYFPNQTVNVATNAEILRITNANITTQTVLVEAYFAGIVSNVVWTSYDGYISFTGTCLTATTANITLGNVKTPSPETPLAIANGGTGANNAADARANIGAASIQYGTDGIWEYHKYDDNTYHAWYEGNINLGAGTAFAGGFFHQSSSALPPPSFSDSVTSMTGAPNSAVLCAYIGHAADYSTYWFNGTSAVVNNVAVRLDMYGKW